ncbi:zinc ribbon domain-containing protein [Candidatus Uabimicrobium sp. HlEnr_7]|uniref:zinc ribbon domain-containing protein n=1 Tax=Candidatus Uabimicrobium helgolandensis TaxID=3095367 RepID=UPI0035592D09
MENLSLLLALQEIDKEIVRIENEQERLPRKLSKTYQEAIEIQENIAKQKKFIDQLKVEEKNNELEIKSIDDLINKKKGHLAVAKTNIEYKTLLKEIDDQGTTRAKTEEKTIELIDKIEVEKSKLKETKSKYNVIADEYEKFRLQVEKELRELSSDLDSVCKKREKKREDIADLEPGTLSEYERIFKNLRGDALVPVQDEYCTSCHMEILAKDMTDLLCKKLVYCEGCFRILYLPELISSS